ncbi:hypothetical protein JZ751_012337 [Albula glossodonta]|uniref:Uncharacterized protein n=1 Tax=Albula glossodonta TaxID=121402 RepID=A0A8T2PS73_9TELE|nr:hypothetical protein JZ751_012337 [Albula glossodonta]
MCGARCAHDRLHPSTAKSTPRESPITRGSSVQTKARGVRASPEPGAFAPVGVTRTEQGFPFCARRGLMITEQRNNSPTNWSGLDTLSERLAMSVSVTKSCVE